MFSPPLSSSNKPERKVHTTDEKHTVSCNLKHFFILPSRKFRTTCQGFYLDRLSFPTYRQSQILATRKITPMAGWSRGSDRSYSRQFVKRTRVLPPTGSLKVEISAK
jgi:hypothetical protein